MVASKNFARQGRLIFGLEFKKVKKFSQADIHFLHIGKCAGTQISHIANQINNISSQTKIIKHGHDVYLKDLEPESRYFFSIRNPISRFKSGFYSRKRKGQPRIYNEWSDHDREAFKDFEHANDLAESLFAAGEVGLKAFAAMKSIRHTAQNQSDWFYKCGHFLEIQPPIWIIRQENFVDDLNSFLKRSLLGISIEQINVSEDHIVTHASDYSNFPALSDKAKENLSHWYAQDYEFYRLCEHWLRERENQ